ncbi:ATP synthase subunit I [Oceanobacillus neutriphilus]|uniref:DUF2178 domain-containing protein n=1 Tax=Oceanobacillus neutriphilus TaxID=531815 RepID=A0ABQ2NNK6_9BACI|nr:ATP synthase subunit I [Oceanobacillus neutriphilus]GGP06846.1 hypothetical protein GCM10011346_00220 [Oceanobacillus neutriphilus]
MSMKDTDKKKRSAKKSTLTLRLISSLIGILLGTILVFFFQGEYPYEVLLGGLTGAVIIAVFAWIIKKRKKDNTPEADERVKQNIFRFSAYASHISLAVLFMGIFISSLLGVESVSMMYLWIFFVAYIWITGIGTVIARRR